MMASRVKCLDFFIVGVQKGATTALASKLGRHPKICCSSPKELHLFDNDSLDWSGRCASDVAPYFNGCDPDLLWGEATPIYMYWPKSIERLAAYNSHAKIIVILRHPAYRALSHWKMEVARRAESLTFAEAVSDVGRARVAPVHRVFSYVERGFYAPQIERILEHFPKQNLFFCRMEDLYLNEAAVLGDMYSFLGVPSLNVESGPKYVVSVDTSGIVLDATAEIAFLSELYKPDIQKTAGLTCLDLKSWSAGGYDESFLENEKSLAAER